MGREKEGGKLKPFSSSGIFEGVDSDSRSCADLSSRNVCRGAASTLPLDFSTPRSSNGFL